MIDIHLIPPLLMAFHSISPMLLQQMPDNSDTKLKRILRKEMTRKMWRLQWDSGLQFYYSIRVTVLYKAAGSV